MLVRETQILRPMAGWIDTGMAVARKTRAGWTALASLLYLRKTRPQESPGFGGKLAGAIAIARSLAAIWKWRS